MPELFGRAWRREELLERVGDLSQVAGVTPFQYSNGKAEGVRALHFRTGGGLTFTVVLGRAMDISHAEYRGIPLSWLSPTGIVSAAYYDPRGSEWLRSFFGGLLTTAGLTQVGPPSVDLGEDLGMHGRISNTPAETVAFGGQWHDQEYLLWARGRMREVKVKGESLLLERGVSTAMGSRRLVVRDSVTNVGHTEVPHMVMYQINVGFPLLDEAAELLTPALEIVPRDETAREGIEEAPRFGPPTSGAMEQVFYHHSLGADPEGYTTVAVLNRSFGGGRGLGLYVRWRPIELPYLVQSKNLAPGSYFLGIAPANCHTEGRAAERARGTLQYLRPGESRTYELEVGVLDGQDELRAAEEQADRLRRRAVAESQAPPA